MLDNPPLLTVHRGFRRAPAELLERPVLLLGREVAVQRQHLQPPFLGEPSQFVGGLPNLPQPGEEREHVPVGRVEHGPDRVGDGD